MLHRLVASFAPDSTAGKEDSLREQASCSCCLAASSCSSSKRKHKHKHYQQHDLA